MCAGCGVAIPACAAGGCAVSTYNLIHLLLLVGSGGIGAVLAIFRFKS